MTKKILTVVVLLTAFAATAVADDFGPPNWRGQPNTTWGRWEFDVEPGAPDAPPITGGLTWFQDYDAGVFPFGDPVLRVEPGATQSWFPVDTRGGSQRVGIWPLSGFLEVELQNSPIARETKEIWIQLTWLPQTACSFPAVEIVDPATGVTVTDFLFQEELDDGWFHTIYHLQLSPNPSQETVQIFGAVDVDELVIDTWCVPEPATMAMLTAGGVVALLRRRKKQA
jgi:hypothetical protein